MVKKVIVLDRQSIWDIAIQEYGEGVTGVFKIMQDNPEVNLTTRLVPGQLLKINQQPSNKVVAQYFADNDLHPAGINRNSVGGFSNGFSNGFNV